MTPEEKRDYAREYRKKNAEKCRQYEKRRRIETPEKIAARIKKWRDANREKINEDSRTYREAHKEKLQERSRTYYEANKEKIAERKRTYHEANKEKIAEYRRAYRAANTEKVKQRGRVNYAANKEKYLLHQRNRYWSDPDFREMRLKSHPNPTIAQKERSRVCARALKNLHPGKQREQRKLTKLFGYGGVPLVVKQQVAITKLSDRVTGSPFCTPIDKSKIPEILNRIEKGETYAAYE